MKKKLTVQDRQCRCSNNLIFKSKPDELKRKTKVVFKKCEF